MTSDQAKAAYRRVCEWADRASNRLRERILVRFFGGCGCRMHNCKVNYNTGHKESSIKVDGKVYTHRQLAKLAKQFDFEQSRIWDESRRLQDAFGKHF